MKQQTSTTSNGRQVARRSTGHCAERSSLEQNTVAMPRLLTQEMVTEVLPVSLKWLERDRWAERRLPFVKIGRRVFYRASDIAAFIDANVQPASAPDV